MAHTAFDLQGRTVLEGIAAGSVSVFATSFSTTPSTIFLWTIIRSIDMRMWPDFVIAPKVAA